MPDGATPDDNVVSIALYEVLAAAGSVTGLLAEGVDSIAEDQPDENAEWPQLVYGEVSGVPNYALGDSEGYRAFLYQVKAVTAGPSVKDAAEIRDAVEAVLSGAALSIPGRNVLVLEKVSNVRMTENKAGTRYNHRGGIYRIWTEGT